MDSDITEIIEEFMESALAQWVCHSSLVTLRVKRKKRLLFHLIASCAGFIRPHRGINQKNELFKPWGVLNSCCRAVPQKNKVTTSPFGCFSAS